MEMLADIGNTNAVAWFRDLLRDIEQALGIDVTIHDRLGVLRDRDGTPLIPNRNIHLNPYCLLHRFETPRWNRACSRDCHAGVDRVAPQVRHPFISRCWKGVREVVVPLFRDDVHVATLFAGAFRDPGEESPPIDGVTPPDVAQVFRELPVLDQERCDRLKRVIMALGLGILKTVEQLNELRETDQDRRSVVARLVQYRAHENVRLGDLAETLCLSPSRASHLVKELFGVSFQELVRRERMQRARVLLLTTGQSLAEIAGNVGFRNVCYFNRVFSAHYGIPPGAYRQKRELPASSV